MLSTSARVSFAVVREVALMLWVVSLGVVYVAWRGLGVRAMWASGISVSSTVSALKELESWMLVVVGVGWLVRVGVTHSVGVWAFEA
jgi:hypothetical protein